MKIAVVSDVHGNLSALEAVLEEITDIGCEKILFLGDYVMAGPEPSDTLNFCMSLSERSNIDMIQGNTDKMIAEYNEEIFNKLSISAPIMGNALKDDVKILSKNQKTFLRELPETMKLLINGVRILMVHGSPRRNNEDILPNTPLDKVEKMLEGTSADLILCGHTHIPCGFQTNTGQTVVNAGSVGRPFTIEPQACYVIITISGEGCFEIEHKFVKYDNHCAAKILSSRNFAGADKLAAILISPNCRHL